VSLKLGLLAAAWDRALRPSVGAARRTPEILCLNYHRVTTDVSGDDGVVSATPAEFEWQVSWLRAHVPLLGGDDVAELARRAKGLAGQAACLTFDDGYADNYEVGVSLARRHGVRATFFIATGFIETGTIPWWDRISYALKRTSRTQLRVRAVAGRGPCTIDVADRNAAVDAAKELCRRLPPAEQPAFVDAVEEAAGVAASDGGLAGLFMSWDQIRELRRLGHAVGAHTHTHPKLSALDPGEQRRELERSKRELEERLGEPVDLLAYPYGTRDAFGEATQQIAAGCGFAAAFSFYGGRNAVPLRRPHDLRRMPVDRDFPRTAFTARLTSRFPF
jgi:peptidoglycan/xylan/chitin deacetylase (PgdA/CDA1 family)